MQCLGHVFICIHKSSDHGNKWCLYSSSSSSAISEVGNHHRNFHFRSCCSEELNLCISESFLHVPEPGRSSSSTLLLLWIFPFIITHNMRISPLVLSVRGIAIFRSFPNFSQNFAVRYSLCPCL